MPSLILLLVCVAKVYAAVSCKDESGKDVDWFMAIKAPSGGSYYYMDPRTPAEFIKSAHDLHNDTGSIVQTVLQLYKAEKSKNGWAVYNDQDDTGKQLASRAHAKGVIVFDTKQGFWLIHSLPKYPNRHSSGYGGLSDYKYAQSWMCVTLETDTFNDVGYQLATAWTQTYDSNLPSHWEESLDKFANYLSGAKTLDVTSTLEIVTKGGQSFRSFSKSKQFGNSIYDDWVNSYYKSPLRVESWQNGIGSMPSNCTLAYPVENIQTISMPDIGWKITQDHSKWCMTANSKKYVACIGDTNRQYSQANRGGGLLCMVDKATWEAFDEIVATIESC